MSLLSLHSFSEVFQGAADAWNRLPLRRRHSFLTEFFWQSTLSGEEKIMRCGSAEAQTHPIKVLKQPRPIAIIVCKDPNHMAFSGKRREFLVLVIPSLFTVFLNLPRPHLTLLLAGSLSPWLMCMVRPVRARKDCFSFQPNPLAGLALPPTNFKVDNGL